MLRPALLAAIMLSMGATAAQACSYDAANDKLSTGPGPAYAEAEGRDWFVSGAPLTLYGKRYEKFGPPLELGAPDFAGLVKAGEWKGVVLFTNGEEDGEVVYVPVNAARCTFQRYGRVD